MESFLLINTTRGAKSGVWLTPFLLTMMGSEDDYTGQHPDCPCTGEASFERAVDSGMFLLKIQSFLYIMLYMEDEMKQLHIKIIYK